MSERTEDLPVPDVCIVGAGPAGIATALALGSAGRSVVLIESGGFRASRFIQELNEGEHEGETYTGLSKTRYRQVGGTVNIWNVVVEGKWGAKFVPLSAGDMETWPIYWGDLEQYYLKAQKVCGLGPFDYGADYWATASRRPFDLEGTGITSGVYQLGFAERFSRDLINSLLRTEGITLVPSATVVGLIVDQRTGRVRGVQSVDMNGRSFELKSKRVILACGAVENARILLLAKFSDPGISTWIGRGFMEHARDFSLVLMPRSKELFSAASFYDLHKSNDGCLIGGRLTLTDSVLQTFCLPNASMTLVPRFRKRSGRRFVKHRIPSTHHIMDEACQGRYGWSHVRSPESVFDAFKIVLNLEQRPHSCNRIELTGRCDRFGNSLPRLVLNWTAQDQARLERLRDLLRDWFEVGGLGHLSVTSGHRPNLNAHHHAGTTRMGLNPEEGVVDHNCSVFGLENLYVAGASVFPTAGFANPTLTIVALALRLADHINSSLG